MAAWPDYAVIQADGYGVRQDPDVRRTPLDDGLVRQEKSYDSALDVRRITAHLGDDEALGRFRAWAKEHAHRWFAWSDPEDGLVREVRVRGGAGGIEYRARVQGGRRRWVLICELEGLRGRTIEIGG